MSEKLAQLTRQPLETQVSLYEELAIARLAASKALALAQPVLLGEITDQRLVAMSIAVLREAMNHVRDMVMAAARIEKDADDKFSLKVLALFVAQITKAVHDELGDDVALCERITRAIDERVRVPLIPKKRYDSHALVADAEILGARTDDEMERPVKG